MRLTRRVRRIVTNLLQKLTGCTMQPASNTGAPVRELDSGATSIILILSGNYNPLLVPAFHIVGQEE